MKILITGIAGFIGSHTAERLNSLGHTVIGIDNFSPYYDVQIKRNTVQELVAKGIIVVESDLRKATTYENLDVDFDYIFHFAAQPGISSAVTFDEYFENNVIATQQLLHFVIHKNKNLKLFVNIGTSSIYGKEAFYGEEKVPEPASNYGVSKLTAEQLVLFHAREKAFKACSLRLFSVFGPRERPDKLYPKLIHAAFTGREFTLFEGSAQHLRSFTFIDDIVDGIVSVVGKEDAVDTQVINLGTSIESTTQQGIDCVERLTGKKINIKVVDKRAGDQLRTQAIIDKARKILDYNPSTTLEAGVKKHIEWYLKR
ncbi:NAD-dependent epimerase/dehydratase family protein [Flavobacterium sp. SM2513]|uniref:NAD-dependent epimerase/dehydratase family protein n=1 Tax=Flavobacterium sp. SM2513 TaxID=3424766 RepID=UPI003D7F9F95